MKVQWSYCLAKIGSGENYNPWQHSAARVAFRDGRCSVPNPTEDRLLKGVELSAKVFATITNQSIQRPSLWKMADWLPSAWKGAAEIEIWIFNTTSVCYCNPISLLSPLAPGLLQPEIPFFRLTPHSHLKSERKKSSCNPRCHVTVLPEDETTLLHQHPDHLKASPSTLQWMFLLLPHSKRTVNLTSSCNNGKYFQQISELIYSDPYRANFEKEKYINIQLRIG